MKPAQAVGCVLLQTSEPRRSDGQTVPKSWEHKQQQKTKDSSILTLPQNQKEKGNSWKSGVKESILVEGSALFSRLPQQQCFLVKFTLNQAVLQRRKQREEAEHKARQDCVSGSYLKSLKRGSARAPDTRQTFPKT